MNETGARGPDQVETEGHEVAHGTASVNGRDVKGEAHAVVSEQVESPDEDDDDWVREQHELDCPLCRALLYEPITTVCGHNFCRSCIVRALDYNNRCPVCRAVVYLAPNHAVNSVLKNLAANTFPKEYRRRIAQTKKEAQEMCHNLPLFVLNIVLFPGMALDLHVFEPRYRNLIAHSLASSRCFGVINGSSKTGCVVEVSSYLRIPDGRSLLLVKGTNRFSVLKRWESPEYGYEIAEVSMLHDRSPDESAMPPAAPVAFDSYNDDDDDDGHASPAQQRHADAPSLQQVAAELRDLVQQKIPPSALQTFQQQLGPLPPQSEPQELSFWVAAYLPVGLTEHQQLLEMTSARDRLVREKELLLNLNTRTIQQRRAPTVARSVDGRRGLAMHVILLVCFIILLIWTRSLEDSLHAEQEPSCLLPSA